MRTIASQRARVDGVSWTWLLTHSCAVCPTETRLLAADTYSPRDFVSSMEVRYNSASRFVLKPRLSVCDLFGW